MTVMYVLSVDFHSEYYFDIHLYCVIFYYMNMPQFVYLFTYWYQFVLSWFFAIINEVITAVLMFMPNTSIICIIQFFIYQLFSSVQSLSHIRLFGTAACQASLSITNSQTLPKLLFITLVMPSNHLILCCPFLLLPSIFPSIRVFSNESALRIRWPKYWSFIYWPKNCI